MQDRTQTMARVSQQVVVREGTGFSPPAPPWLATEAGLADHPQPWPCLWR